ncbi:MAG: hypothetical protein AABZ14_06150 [Candidatus Margulisiibacteriota bacterium]
MIKDPFELEREQEERAQAQLLKDQGLFQEITPPPSEPVVQKVIQNPDVKVVRKTPDSTRGGSYVVAEYELLKLKAELLSKPKPSETDHQKLAEIIQKLL